MNTTNQQPGVGRCFEKSRDAIAAAKTLEYDISAPADRLPWAATAPKTPRPT